MAERPQSGQSLRNQKLRFVSRDCRNTRFAMIEGERAAQLTMSSTF